ncbi:unnamed protein product [Ixodes persulcatus]
MPEVIRVRHVLKGIAEEAVHLFVLQPPADVNSIRTLCQSLEAARRQRISTTDTSLSSTSALSFLPHGDQFPQIIRAIVREELASCFKATLPSINNSPTANLRSIVRDKAQSGCSSFHHSTPFTIPTPTYIRGNGTPSATSRAHSNAAFIPDNPSGSFYVYHLSTPPLHIIPTTS